MWTPEPLTAKWRRASRCASNGCVEARMAGDEVTVRNSKRPDGASVSYHRDEWSTCVTAVKAGEFDLDQTPLTACGGSAASAGDPATVVEAARLGLRSAVGHHAPAPGVTAAAVEEKPATAAL